jgi:acyl carrier protein
MNNSTELVSMHANEQKLKELLAAVLQIPAGDVGVQTSAATVASWDSLNHLNLILALEGQFDVRIPTDEFTEMMSYPRIKDTLTRCGISFEE